MSSKVEIANQALTLIGAQPITDFLDDNNRARAINRVYEPVRRQMLHDHPYNFAMTRASLPASSVAPVHTFARAFVLPSDCLRVMEAITDAYKWTTENREIITDAPAPLAIIYIKDEEDPLKMSPAFRKAMSYQLAAQVCFELTGNSALMERVDAMAQRTIRSAKSIDGQEGKIYEPADGSWLESRL